MRILKLYNIGDRVVLTDEWVKTRYEEYVQFNESFFEKPLTEEQKERHLQSLKDIKEKAIGFVVENTLTQQFVQYAVEWDRDKTNKKPPYAWFNEEEIKLYNEQKI